MFKKISFWLFSLVTLVQAAAFAEGRLVPRSNLVLVSVAPYKFFVEKIAGETVKVNLMVPAGASAHTYEPTPKQMLTNSHADLWFLIGESFESRALAALQNHNSRLSAVDMRQGVDLIYADNQTQTCCCHGSTGVDLHFWLSPKMVKIQAHTIADALIRAYPENKARYQQSLEQFLKELDELDQEIKRKLEPLQVRTVMVSHPAYAYYCRDYNLNQLSIEFEGKDPTPYQLTTIIQKAKQLHINTIFVQKQYSSKGAKLIAAELKAKIVVLDPYAEDFYSTMREITSSFAGNKGS